MGNLFGVRRKVLLVTAQDRAILQLKQQRDKIKMYQKRTETDLVKSKELALKLYQTGLAERAVVVLRRKKRMEEILLTTDKQLETLEQLVSDIEYSQIEVSVVEGLKVGTESLKQLNSLMNIDDIQQMMEDNQEAAAKQKEISDILRLTSERFDEDELLAELDRYIDKKPTDVKDADKSVDKEVSTAELDLPAVPETEPTTIDPAEEEKVLSDGMVDEANSIDSKPKQRVAEPAV